MPRGAPDAAAARCVWCVVVALLITGSTGSVCFTAVESLDLGCLLRWDCPRATANTTYTVQTKTQGDPWQDVPWCVWVSSHSCDVSHAFSNFELYNMVRLGVHLSPVSVVWVQPRKFDYSDFTFSPPSVSASLEDERLLVEVQFPCAANRRCSLGLCCPVSELIDPWTTVTVYNQLNRSEYQSRTVWSQEVASRVEFSGLSPGQNYCAVANFSFPTFSMAASPRSAPQCVQTVSRSGPLPAWFLGIGLTSLLLFPLLTVFLSRPEEPAAAEENPPKIPASVQEPASALPLASAPVDPRDVHLEFDDDQISVGSPADRNQTSTHASEPLREDAGPEAAYWDTGGMKLEQGPNSGLSIALLF